MMRHLATILFAATAVALSADRASAQSSQTDYNVYVPPYMTLQQIRPDRTANHPQTAADVRMGSSIWRGLTVSNTGSTIILETDQPFQNLSIPSAQRDARLRIPRIFGFGGWSIDNGLDETNVPAKPGASVQISSTGPGLVFIPLEVTFITGNHLTLAGGTYQLTVTGTITAN